MPVGFIERIKRARRHSLRFIVKRILYLGFKNIKYHLCHARDIFFSTYISDISLKAAGYTVGIKRIFNGLVIENIGVVEREIEHLCARYLDHRYDLLGSGWVQVKHGMRCSGLAGHRYTSRPASVSSGTGSLISALVNFSNRRISNNLFRRIADQDYIPIDWGVDFKSGYRWSSRVWYRNIEYGHLPGVDVKVPWELARMQHLPQLAIGYKILAERGAGADALQHEFCNQIIDFVATNPPRYGVNWTTTMDVAIRVVNWLIAFDLFREFGAVFTRDFERIFFRSVVEHGRHIERNLEWNPTLRGNHYLSNIVGLVFVAAYLPRNRETNRWLLFGVDELVKEVKLQFHEDGSNFEGSTCYHRLSAEMVVYATAVLLGMDKREIETISALACPAAAQEDIRWSVTDRGIDFSPQYYALVEKMAEFVVQLEKPAALMPQFGDNDSGRFLKLQPVGRFMSYGEAVNMYANLSLDDARTDDVYWDEDFLNHRHLVAAANGLLGKQEYRDYLGRQYIEEDIVRNLAGGRVVFRSEQCSTETEAGRQRGDPGEIQRLLEVSHTVSGRHRHLERFDAGSVNESADFSLSAYPDFGVYIYRSQSKQFYLAVKCGGVGQNGYGGHDHIDQLSVELSIAGEDVLRDPGTCIYTPLPEQRNLYRSRDFHCMPYIPELGHSYFNGGLFILDDPPSGECLCFSRQGFAGRVKYGDFFVYRLIYFDSCLNILDFVDPVDSGVNDSVTLRSNYPLDIPYSPGYGKIIRN